MAQWKPNPELEPGPKYLAVVGTLERDIEAGVLSRGDKLPAQRELADMFGVTIATVTKAIAEASRRGLIVTKKGSGTFVADARTDTAQADRVVDLALNTLPVTVVSAVLNTAMSEISSGGETHRLFGYSPYLGDEDSERVARSWMERCGWPQARGPIFPTQGTQQGLMTALRCLTRPGDTVLCEALTFTGILRISDYLGLTPHGVAFDDNGLDPAALDAAFAKTGARVVVLMPVIQNPTMLTMPRERRLELAEVCRRHDAHLVEDGIYMPLVGDLEAPISSHMPERAIFLTGLSKCLAPGFRLGFAAVPPQLRASFHELLIAASWLSPPFFPAVAAHMLDTGALDECIRLHRAEAVTRLKLADDILDIGMDRDSPPSYHAWIRAPQEWDVDNLLQEAFTHGIRITPSKHFCCPNVPAPSAFRISLGAEEDRATLESGLRRLAGVMKQPSPFLGAVI